MNDNRHETNQVNLTINDSSLLDMYFNPWIELSTQKVLNSRSIDAFMDVIFYFISSNFVNSFYWNDVFYISPFFFQRL